MDAADLLAAHIAKRDINPTQFARELGVPQPMVSMWLHRRRRPGRDNAIAIEKKTGVSASEWRRVRLTPGAQKRKRRSTAHTPSLPVHEQ